MKDYTVVFLETANEDLREVGRFIALDNKAAALRWVDMLEDQANSLGRFPEKGRPYKGDYRIKVVDRGYRIFYRVDHERETVVIVHFYTPKDPRFMS